MKKLFSFTILAMIISFASFALNPIAGDSIICTGHYANLSDSAYPGGTWSSSNLAVATVDLTGGYVLGLSAGVTTITYTEGGSFVTMLLTVSPMPAAIVETPTSFCTGATSICTDATAGGTWSVFNPTVATVSGSGVVTGVNAGTDYVYYSVAGCTVSIMDTVTGGGAYAGTLSYPGTICVGSAASIIDSGGASGGTWSSSNTSIATVNSSGVITGIADGTATITYTISGGACGASVAYVSVLIGGATLSGTISGSSSVNVGANIVLSDYGASAAGTWSSSNPSVASISTGGIVTGMSVGTVVITYSVDGCSGIATTTYTVTVNSSDIISGYVLFSGTPYYGNVKVWLIHYNPLSSMLEAIDSVTVYCSDSNAYYQFTGAATDSFRIKAAISDSAFSDSGYVPTYHTSSFYWNTANVLYHTSGTSDLGQNIIMGYGASVSGPGFIGGNVTLGANKGTSMSIPDVGLLIFAINATTGTLTQQAYTDASGNYTFSNLPLGTYNIYPEAINYATTAYNSITLTSSAESMNAADFQQHTVSKTITPITSGISNTTASAASVFTYPNPVNGKLNIQWNENSTEKGTLIISDITGREISKATLNMNQGSGNSQVDLSALTEGIYTVTIKSGNIDYTNKIEIQH